MISIALVLFLILGVNQVFQYTTQAVGAGEAINSAIRSSRAAEAALAGDFGAMVPPGNGPTDSAALIISMMQAYAYRNKADLAAEGTYPSSLPFSSTNNASVPAGAPFQDFANSGNFGDANVPGDVTYPYTYNARNHRLDVISFFARDLFHRQTGNPGIFVDNMAGTDAWVWYGHLQLPDNGGFDLNIDFPHTLGAKDTFPCAGSPATNPNNCFGSQLVLGRVATLLVPRNTTTNTIPDAAGNAQWFLQKSSSSTPLDPLGAYSSVNQAAASAGGDTGPYHLPDARVDLADTSITGYRSILSPYSNPGSASYTNWWDLLMDGNPTYTNNQQYTRFKCNPFLSKPMQSVNMAMASPYFLGGCSQFTVEYAGDYMVQDNNPGDVYSASVAGSMNYGAFKSAGSDGQIDYQLITTGTGANAITRKQIIWYGLPRNTSGTGTITYNGSMPTLNQTSNPPISSMPNGDVAPLAAWLGKVQSFEKSLPGVASATAGNGYSMNSGNTIMANGDRYTCAWAATDVKPKLIRITLTLDDPTGRLPDGQTYQYVFAVP